MEDKLGWLTRERQDLIEANRGKWVVIDKEHNKVFANDDLDLALDEYEKEHPGETPSIFKVPREDEEFILL